MMKRLFSIVLVAFMLVFALSVSAADVDTIGATASQTEVNPGDTFTVALDYAKVIGFGGLDVTVEFDNTKLVLDSIDSAGAIADFVQPVVANANANGGFSMPYAGLANVTISGKIAVLTFTVKDDVLPGDIDFAVTADPAKCFYYDGQEMVDLVVETDVPTIAVPKFDVDVAGAVVFEGETTVAYDGTDKSATLVMNVVKELPTGFEVVTVVEPAEVVNVGVYTYTATLNVTDAADLNTYNVPANLELATATLTIEPAVIEVATLDLDAKTATFTGVVDGDAVELNFDNVVVEKVVDGDESYWLVSGFAIAGADFANYTLKLADDSDEVAPFVIAEADINPDNIVTVTVNSIFTEGEDVVDEVVEVYEFYKGMTCYLFADDVDGFEFGYWEIDGDPVSEAYIYDFEATEDFEIYAYYVDDGNALAAITAILAGTNRKVKVYFDTFAGSQVHTQTVAKGDCVVRPVNPTKGNLKFGGWYTDKEFKNLFDFDEPVTKDIVLYAKWDTPDNRIIMTIDRVEAMVFGENVANDVPPIIVNDRTMLPARFVAESLGAKVSWDIVTRKATIVGNGKTIEIIVGETTAYVNGVAVTIDSPAFIRNDRTYTPVRFIAETLGANVSWVAADRQVIITK